MARARRVHRGLGPAMVERLAARVVEGQSGGGVVKVEVTGGWEFQSVTISPEAGASRRSSRGSCLRDDGAGRTDMGNLGDARTEVASHRIGPHRQNLSAPRP